MTVLRESSPRILGGRDELAGGTWLAVNDRGVVAGLTNRPSPAGRDPNLRSRGELPLLLATESSACDAVRAFVAAVEPSRYNSAWLLVGDRRSLAYIEVDGDALRHRELSAGIHVLENRPLDAPSGKVDRARALLGDPSGLSAEDLVSRLTGVLADHEVTAEPASQVAITATASRARPACVHGETYGTRSSTIVLVPEGPRPIIVHVANGRPCSNPFTDETGRWAT